MPGKKPGFALHMHAHQACNATKHRANFHGLATLNQSCSQFVEGIKQNAVLIIDRLYPD